MNTSELVDKQLAMLQLEVDRVSVTDNFGLKVTSDATIRDLRAISEVALDGELSGRFDDLGRSGVINGVRRNCEKKDQLGKSI